MPGTLFGRARVQRAPGGAEREPRPARQVTRRDRAVALQVAPGERGQPLIMIHGGRRIARPPAPLGVAHRKALVGHPRHHDVHGAPLELRVARSAELREDLGACERLLGDQVDQVAQDRACQVQRPALLEDLLHAGEETLSHGRVHPHPVLGGQHVDRAAHRPHSDEAGVRDGPALEPRHPRAQRERGGPQILGLHAADGCRRLAGVRGRAAG